MWLYRNKARWFGLSKYTNVWYMKAAVDIETSYFKTFKSAWIWNKLNLIRKKLWEYLNIAFALLPLSTARALDTSIGFYSVDFSIWHSQPSGGKNEWRACWDEYQIEPPARRDAEMQIMKKYIPMELVRLAFAAFWVGAIIAMILNNITCKHQRQEANTATNGVCKFQELVSYDQHRW